MRFIKISPPKLIAILFLAALPLFILGRSAPGGQLNGLILFCVLGASLLLPNIWLKLIGLIVSGWLGYAYALAFVKPFPLASFVSVSIIIFFGLTFYLFVFHSTLSPDFYFGAISLSALIQALLAICQNLWFDPVSTAISSVVTPIGELNVCTPVGTLANPNFLGAYLAISLPFFFRRGWVWFVPIIAYGLYITNARAACGAAIVGTGFFFWGWKGFLGAIIPGLAYIITAEGHSWSQLLNSDRYSFWTDAIQRVCHSIPSFLVGYGQGTPWKTGHLLHSEYVMTFFNYGATGLFCMIAYIVTTLGGRKTRPYVLTAFLILCVNMAANHPLHTVPTAILAIIIIALLDREKEMAKNHEQ